MGAPPPPAAPIYFARGCRARPSTGRFARRFCGRVADRGARDVFGNVRRPGLGGRVTGLLRFSGHVPTPSQAYSRGGGLPDRDACRHRGRKSRRGRWAAVYEIARGRESARPASNGRAQRLVRRSASRARGDFRSGRRRTGISVDERGERRHHVNRCLRGSSEHRSRVRRRAVYERPCTSGFTPCDGDPTIARAGEVELRRHRVDGGLRRPELLDGVPAPRGSVGASGVRRPVP